MVIPTISGHHGARYLSSCTALLVLAAVACRQEAPLTPRSDEPFLYLVLAPEPIPTRAPPPTDSTVRALLLTAGTPLASPYRSAERFELRRSSDGTTFQWTEATPVDDRPVDFRGVTVDAGNYVLPEGDGSSTLPGRRSMRPLDVFDLRVESGGRIVEGRVVIPARPTPILGTVDGGRVVVWGRVSGAAAYIVDADTEGRGRIVTADTVMRLAYDRDPVTIPRTPEFRVVALDTNLYRYMVDTTRSRSGLSGGLGVFGAVSSARLALPSP